jgi:acyl carrier protein
MERLEIESKVTQLVGDVLGVEERKLHARALLVTELAASSIDIIEINFRLEQEFGIEIAASEFWNLSQERSDPRYVQDGRLTPEGIEMLRGRFVRFEHAGVHVGDPIQKLFDSFSLGMVVDYVEGRLQGRQSACATAAG